jgi:enoyl-CoA hydratase
MPIADSGEAITEFTDSARLEPWTSARAPKRPGCAHPQLAPAYQPPTPATGNLVGCTRSPGTRPDVAGLDRQTPQTGRQTVPDLTIHIDGHVATVTLDRPPVNAIDRGTMAEIGDAFRSFDDNREVRAAIFTAAGDRAFMAGVDLRSVGQPAGSPDQVAPTLVTDPPRVARDAMWAITDCAVPVIGAINGPALGAGLAFAACCDILVAAEGASFGAPEINVGLLGASAHVSMLVGRYKAREMYFTGEEVSAAELHRLGAVRAVVPREDLLATAQTLAQELAAKSPIALRLAKESMNRVEYLSLKEAYRTEQDYTARLSRFDDAAEARSAFAEKRRPDWKWR